MNGHEKGLISTGTLGSKKVNTDSVRTKIMDAQTIMFKNINLESILNNIFDNFRNLNHDGNYSRNFHSNWK